MAPLPTEFAKAFKCKAVTDVGPDEKALHCVDTLGYDAAVERKDPDFAIKKFATAWSDGVDVLFDNTGGEIYYHAVSVMGTLGRILGCGRIGGGALGVMEAK